VPSNSEVDSEEERQNLLDWIDSRPELAYIRSTANSAICNYQTDAVINQERIVVNSPEIKTQANSLLRQMFELVWVPGQNLRGKAYSSQSSDASLESVAKLMSLSTLWDFATTIPVLSFPLQLSTGVFAFPIAFTLSFFLLLASNIAGENATNRSSGHRLKATASLLAFLLLSVAKTAVSGVGTDLVIGIRGIQQEYASKLVKQSLDLDQKILAEKKAALYADPLLAEQTKKCDENRKLLSRLARTDPGWQAAYLAEGGQYKDRIATIDQVRKRYGSPANMPACLAVRVLSEDKNSLLAKPTSKLQERQEASKSLPPLSFLKIYYPQQFTNSFIESKNGDLAFRDGTLAVGEATSLFFSKLSQPSQVASLGFSLFTFGVSVTLTIASTMMLLLISKNREIRASFSPELEGIKAAYIGRYRKIKAKKSPAKNLS